jgi:uncharacterized membrane-anchored protein YitT (DUF2179 family)
MQGRIDPKISRKTHLREAAADYAQIVIGSILVALGTNLFLVPNNVVSGGITGVAIIGHTLLHTPVGIGVFVLNLPLFWLGWRFVGGGRFIVRTVIAVTILSAAIDITAPLLHAPTHDRLLVICYGGLLDGLGVGLVFRGRGTTGGTDVFARLARRYLGMPMGTSLLLINVVIFLAAAKVYGLEPVMVALALAFVSARVVDLVQDGLSTARAALIVTTKPDEVREAVIDRLDRGVTILQGEGGYSGEKRPVLFVVVSASEVVRLKRIMADVDKRAFITIAPAREVLGEGFAPNRPADA